MSRFVSTLLPEMPQVVQPAAVRCCERPSFLQSRSFDPESEKRSLNCSKHLGSKVFMFEAQKRAPRLFYASATSVLLGGKATRSALARMGWAFCLVSQQWVERIVPTCSVVPE